MKASNHLFLLLALLPIPKFIERDSKVRGMLEAQLVHRCLDFVTEPLKKAAKIRVMMFDPVGSLRYCFTPLIAYIADTPEAATIAGVTGKTSHITMASYKEFSDSLRHPPRTAENTLLQLISIKSQGTDPNDLKTYGKEALKYHLNGVHHPFWRNWPMAQPDTFLTPEPLHHWHKQFWDHDVKWCIQVIGGAEINFQFSVLHPTTGFCQFPKGIANLKQVTGQEHRDIQRYLISVIADAVPNCPFLIAVQALMDFWYMAQAPCISDSGCEKIQQSFTLFHEHKDAIIKAGARRGKANKVITEWHIPKLEFLQSVVPSIRGCGVPIQWSAHVTEQAHISEIKYPSRLTNNQQYEAQIVCHLDRVDKCHRFDLATSLQDSQDQLAVIQLLEGLVDDKDLNDRNENSDRDSTNLIQRQTEYCSPQVNYFSLAVALAKGEFPNAPLPYQTFAIEHAAFHL